MYIWQKRSNTYNVKNFLHRLSKYQWFHITFCWQKILFMRVTSHERHGISNYRELDCLFKSLFSLRLRNIMQRITDPFWGESTRHWWIPWIPLTIWKAFPYHDVIMFRFIGTLWLWHRRCKSFSIFCTWGLPIIMTTDVAFCMRKMLFYSTIFLKPLIQSTVIFLDQSNNLNNKPKLHTP